MKDELLEKLLLIYEFDENSPLFARVAQHYLEEKEIQRAMEILEHGLKLYPDYPTGHIIMGKAAVINGEYEKAKAHFLEASQLINSSDTLAYYNNKLDNVIKRELETQENFRTPFFEEELFNKSSDFEEQEVELNNFVDSDDEIERIANEIRKAKIPKAESSNENIEGNYSLEIKNKEMVSDTLAGIYFAQGNFAEALTMYKKLILIHPEKEIFYNTKVLEIKTILEKKNN
ncbi:MAG: hypothetical protein V1773_12975 [bacterium]